MHAGAARHARNQAVLGLVSLDGPATSWDPLVLFSAGLEVLAQTQPGEASSRHVTSRHVPQAFVLFFSMTNWDMNDRCLDSMLL